MQKYDDTKNQNGMKIIFMLGQMVVLSIVYIFVYTSFLAVGYAIDKYDASPVMYFPVFVALAVFPILLYKYRKMFNAGNMLLATTWTMGTASLTIVLLYVYIAQITG
jgi:lipopolysaccharide/colanic/teichoic acid biosynthesis glycosyltransferase